jgi:hypothetical protein
LFTLDVKTYNIQEVILSGKQFDVYKATLWIPAAMPLTIMPQDSIFGGINISIFQFLQDFIFLPLGN